MNEHRSYVTHSAAEASEAQKVGRRQAAERARERFASKPAAPVIAYDEAGTIVGVIDPKDIEPIDPKKVKVFDGSGQLLGLADPAKLVKADTGQPAPQQPAQPQQPVPPAAPAAS